MTPGIAPKLILLAVLMLSLAACGENPTEVASSTLTPSAAAAVTVPPPTPTAPAPPTATSAPLVYTVQPGDTLSGIAQQYDVTVQALIEANGIQNPDQLSIGQMLVIPNQFVVQEPPPSTAEASEPMPPLPSPTPEPTITPVAPPLVEIADVAHAGNLSDEVVTLGNGGGMAHLEGWRLSDAGGNYFVFPALTLFAGSRIRVHSEAGETRPTDLYWGRTAPAWSSGELITLLDDAGDVVDTHIVP